MLTTLPAEKMTMIEDIIEKFQSRIVLVSDLDVAFKENVPSIAHTIERAMNLGPKPLDLLFQRDNDVEITGNIGFFAMRCNDKAKMFWRAVHSSYQGQPGWNDQLYANNVCDLSIRNVF